MDCICNFTGGPTNRIIEYHSGVEVLDMADDNDAREKFRLTSLSHGAG